MNRAEEIFRQVPKTHNCAQAVAAGCGAEELVAELATCGRGNAPQGLCGALYAAMRILPGECHEDVRREFATVAGAERCREIREQNRLSCAGCVRCAAELV
ncbi:MAG: 2-amino-4-hydroxy-6-hydroxymethyldihydropteridine pyrophosphokinase, partial [Planctomycetia bacterium]|nr:2-amino-4-hydroxy-6-hydroxymethyldihydropteridine pyrophosphokinase [Planctomycetia bacterium]